MTQVSIRIEGIEKLRKLAEKSPAIVEKHVNQAINRSLLRILRREKQVAPFGVSGQLRDRWSIILSRFAGILTSGVDYSVAVHEGTRPHFVSPESLKQWAAKKGLNPYAVSKSIAKKGTKANPFFKGAVEDTSKDVNKEFAIALEGAMNELGD